MNRDKGTIDALLDMVRILRRHYDDCARGMGLTMSRARVISILSATRAPARPASPWNWTS